MITHRYTDSHQRGYCDDDDYSQRSRGNNYEEEEYDGGEAEPIIDNHEQKCLKHKIYQCTIAITNVSPKVRQATLLYQIPNGSVPMNSSKYINSKELEIKPYKSKQVRMQFYFPSMGEFEHQPSNISIGGFVIAKSKLHTIKVIDKKVVEFAKTFQDSMDIAKSNDERKEFILDLFKNNI